MGQINQPSNLLDRIKQAETQLSRLWKAVGLSSATIAKGGLTLLNNAFIKMLDVTDAELLYIGPDDLGQQIVRIRDANGNIIFGSVSGGAGEQRVAINPEPDDIARIDFYDDGATDHVTAVMFGDNFLMQRETNADRTNNGGKIGFFGPDTAVFGIQSATTEFTLRVESGTWGLLGKFPDYITTVATAGWFTGSVDVAGVGSVSLSYGPTMASEMNPVCTLFNAGGVLANCLTAASTTGFTFAWTAATNARVIFWCFRT